MAYPSVWREFPRRLAMLRDRLPVDCLLCQSRAPGGLCMYCRDAVCASMGAGTRCWRCDLPLGDAVPVPVRAPDRGGAGELRYEMAGDGPERCPDCAAMSPAFERVVAAFDYAWPGELLIQRLKLQGRFGCAPVLSRLLAERCREAAVSLGRKADQALGETAAWWGSDALVVPVPAGRRSIRLRGFNPAAELGRDFARRLGLPWRPDLLWRDREGQDQKQLGRRSRRDSVRGLYHCSEAVAGRDIIVVDDVMTTGSTLDAIASVFKGKGAVRVWGVVAARTPSVRAGRPDPPAR